MTIRDDLAFLRSIPIDCPVCGGEFFPFQSKDGKYRVGSHTENGEECAASGALLTRKELERNHVDSK